MLRSWLPRGPDGAACCPAEREGETGKHEEIEVVCVVAHDLATFETRGGRRTGEILLDTRTFARVHCVRA